MRVLGLALGAGLVIAAQAAATDARFEKILLMLDPSERLEQLCDYTAMTRIRKEARSYRPDRALANAMAPAQVSYDTIKASGGAFRSRGKWYALAYDCTAHPDHLAVVSFHYTIGAEIPQPKWVAYGLWE